MGTERVSSQRIPTELPGKGTRTFLGHPLGLVYLAGTEFWERVSYVGMEVLLLLYMVEHLLLPGHVERIAGFEGFRVITEAITGPLSTQALASQICGFYFGLSHLTSVFGGLLGDRILGRRRSVTIGALLMTIGHLCMVFEDTFLVALLLLILGAGALRANLASQVGNLYEQHDKRREHGFQVYYSLANSGAFVAPLVTGLLSREFGWRYGFGFAGLGMLMGLALYWSGAKYLPPDAPRTRQAARTPLSSRERRIVLVLLAMLPILALFWVAQSQVWNTYNLWARNHVDLVVAGWRMPVQWLQAFDGLAPVAVLPLVLWVWRRQAASSREPDDLMKLSLGCFIFGLAFLWLAGSDLFGKVPLAWALAFHVISSVGWVYFSPTAVAIFSRAAPARFNAVMIALCSVSVFIGSTVSGRMGGLYEQMPTGAFWLLHAGAVLSGGALIFILAPRLRRELGIQ